jgi:imidazolonepropionase-like amidohydrolase
MDDECIEKMAERGTVFVPTLAIMNYNITHGKHLGHSDALIAKYSGLQEIRMEAVRKAHAAGVPIALGTDSSSRMAPHGGNAVEFKLLQDAGLSPMESLMAGTREAAKAIGLEALVGTIEPGKKADFVVVRSNPLDDLSILQNKFDILNVWKDGKLVIDRLSDRDGLQLRWPLK